MRWNPGVTGPNVTLLTSLRRAAAALAAAVVVAGAGAPAWAQTPRAVPRTVRINLPPVANRPGVILIADQFNNRVIEVDRLGNITWQFGQGPTDFSPHSIIGVNDAQRVGALTLMAGTGTPPNTVPTCMLANGCPDNRVLLVNRSRDIVWQYGKFGVTGAGPDELNTPTQATYLPSGNILITDQGNQRVIEVSMTKDILWQYGTTGVPGSAPDQLSSPNSAELLDNGHVLIADEANNRAIEVDRGLAMVAEFTAKGTVNGMAFASRLPNGDTLLTDSGNARIVEVDAHDNVVWEYFTNTAPGGNKTPQPTRAIRLATGDTIISDQFNQRVIIVNMAKRVVAEWGNLDRSGYSPYSTTGGLYAPYDAKLIGDYTGLTAPFDHDGDADDHF